MAEETVNKTENIAEEGPSSAINSKMNQPSILDKIGDFLTLRGKIIGGVVAVIILGFLGWMGYQKFIVEPENIESAKNLYQAESHLVDTQNWKAAIKGDTLAGTYQGFEAQAKKFEGYAGGDIANYDLGVAYLNNGQPAEALAAFQKVNFDDENLATITLGAMGDASINLGKYNEAADYYSQAYNRRPKNEMTAPIYMLKLANTYEIQKKYDEAAKLYKDLISNFPNSELKSEAEKNLVFVEAGTSIYEIK